ncbi:WD40 repeat-like protein [Calocera cornea HHB12733]|uniref:WD40 repeat-like protein n=1 Tax=Calocera cornea HHB12733 TaxID=1353952 RepID=A0A165HM91_9BASI|nr:WD40 repeat-like protein [Calocera cornea HHB12733]
MPTKGSIRVGVSRPGPEKKKARIANGKQLTPVKKPAVRRPPTSPSKSLSKAKAVSETAHIIEPTPPSRPCKSFVIVSGSYEKLLYGLEGSFPEPSEASTSTAPVPTLKPKFIFPAHVGSVRAIATSPDGGKWLATGSTDEIVKVWNLKRRKEIGGLVQHDGSITYLGFPTRSTLVSASEDGTIALFRVRGWELLRSLKGHTGRVNCVAVHPSGKVALSVGKDRTLRMWDLIRGKGVASVKLGKEGELVRWNAEGTMFAVGATKEVDLYTTDMKLLSTISHPSRIHDVRFCKTDDGASEVLLVTAEDKKVSIYQLPEGEGAAVVIAELFGHTNRVKSVDTIQVSLPAVDDASRTTVYAVTASSDGFINLYDLAAIPKPSSDAATSPLQISPITSYNTKGTRLTCVAFAEGEVEGDDIALAVNGKRKRDDEEETDVIDASELGEEEEEVEEEEEEFGGFEGEKDDEHL